MMQRETPDNRFDVSPHQRQFPPAASFKQAIPNAANDATPPKPGWAVKIMVHWLLMSPWTNVTNGSNHG